MNATERSQTAKQEAARKFRGFIATGIKGLFQQGWDRLNALDFDVDLRSEPTVANARALLWIAENR